LQDPATKGYNRTGSDVGTVKFLDENWFVVHYSKRMNHPEDLAPKYEMYQIHIGIWEKEFLNKAASVFGLDEIDQLG
jgi:hypothetical protein